MKKTEKADTDEKILVPKNGRVIIVDDIPDEGIPLLKALCERGVSALYYTGEVEHLPENPLKGIRLVFLDIKLSTEGQDEKTVVSTLIGVLKKIISINNGPYAIIAWTQHEDYLRAFAKKISTLEDIAKPVFILDMEKNYCREGEKDFKFDRIKEKLEEKLSELRILRLLILWEQLVHDSAGEVTEIISSMASLNSWNDDTEKIFYKLASELSGKERVEKDPDLMLRSSLYSINGVLIDCLERCIDSEKNTDLLKKPEKESLERDCIAKINSMIQIKKDPDITLMPGNLYTFDSYEEFKKAIPILPEKEIDFFDAFLQEDLSQKDDQEKQKLISEFRSAVRLIVVETTPLCDYVQDRYKVARIIPGVIWPARYGRDNRLKKADFLYETGILSIEDATVCVLLHSNLITSIPKAFLENRPPLLRLRKDLLTHIQQWFSRHISRYGILSLREEEKGKKKG